MYVGLTQLVIAIFSVLLLLAWAVWRTKAQIVLEKEMSFSFVLGSIIENCLLANSDERVELMAKRVSAIRGSISQDEFVKLCRAACILALLRIRMDINSGNTELKLLDASGEHTRFLFLQVAGVGNPVAHELAHLAISMCEKMPDSFPSEEFCGAVLQDVRFTKDGQTTFSTNDLRLAQGIIECRLATIYGQNMDVRLLETYGLKAPSKSVSIEVGRRLTS
jgi:hypothetical protein